MRILEYIKLIETPMMNFQTLGDLHDEGGSFSKEDLRAMRNQKWIEKVKRFFDKSEFNFNVYIVNLEDGLLYVNGKKLIARDIFSNANKYAGWQSKKNIETMIGVSLPDFSNAINVIIVENEGNEKVNLTPWMLTHRMVHALVWSNDALLSIFEGFYHECYSSKEILAKIGPFKSASNLANTGEFLIDLFVSYIFRNKVVFKLTDQEDFNKTLKEYEDIFKKSFERILRNSVGKGYIL